MKVILCLKPHEKKILWIADILQLVNSKGDSTSIKTFKGVIESKETMSDPIDTILSFLNSEPFELVTNYKYIYDYFKNNDKVSVSFKKDLGDSISFEDIISYNEINNPYVPDNINKGTISNSSNFVKNLSISIKLFKTYLYFLENPEKTQETDFVKELKTQGVIPQDTTIEDLLVLIEDELAKDL